MIKNNSIYVDVKRIIGEIDPKIYGFNLEHFTRFETGLGNNVIYGGIFDEDSKLSDEHGFRKDVIKACKKIKVPLLRWPGGNFVSGYHWMDGVGRRDDRLTLYNFAWNTEDTNRFGTDEFMQFCRLIGAEPFITVNAGSGTAEEAAHWVEYCNRKGNTFHSKLREKNGHEEPYNVTYWSIGNEIWGDFQTGHMKAEDYAQKARDFSKLMKKMDPRIRTTLVGSNLGEGPDWDQTVLENLANPFIYHNQAVDLIDTISFHKYYSMLLPGDEDDYYRILAFPLDAEKQLKLKKSIIDVSLSKLKEVRHGFPSTSSNEIGISFDEWNISGSHTLRDALSISRYLNVFQRLAKILEIGCFEPLVNRIGPQERYSAPISVYPDRIVLEAGYHVFDLYVNHTGSLAVDSYVDSETYDLEFEPGIKVWNSWKERLYEKVSIKNISFLDTSTTLSEDRRTLYIATVNTHRDEDITCSIDIRGGTPDKEGLVHELNAQDVDACNDRDNKYSVKIEEKLGISVDREFNYTFPAHSTTVIEIPMT